MTEVWVCETGDYEDRYIQGVYSSPDAAWAAVKATYGPPYIVQWDEPTQDRYADWTLTGQFQAVQHYSTAHTAHFDLMRYEVDAKTQSDERDSR